MSTQHPLFSQVALTEDFPEYNLKKGDVATIVEHYPMLGQEDGYSLEGFERPNVTIEVAASQIAPVPQSDQLIAKLRQLSPTRLIQLDEYLDFLIHKEKSEHQAKMST